MKDTRTPLDQVTYNKVRETYTLADDMVNFERLFRLKGVKGGIAELFKKQYPDHVFSRAMNSHGSTQQEFECEETGQRYILRINGAKVVD